MIDSLPCLSLFSHDLLLCGEKSGSDNTWKWGTQGQMGSLWSCQESFVWRCCHGPQQSKSVILALEIVFSSR